MEGVNPKDLVGVKKAPLRFVPPSLVIETAPVLALGAAKYSQDDPSGFNWRAYPVRQMVYIEAAMRHLFAVIDGEDLDPESGRSHEAHAAACLAIIMDARANGTLTDDRPKPGPASTLLSDQNKSKVVPERTLGQVLQEATNRRADELRAQFLDDSRGTHQCANPKCVLNGDPL